MSKELTGYPSIDKPQMKFYREKPLQEFDVNQTIYELIVNLNQDNLDTIAIEYLDRKCSYRELFEETDKMANAFYELGIRENDAVLVGILNSPETPVILMALNKIGAVSKWFDVRAGEKDIEYYANSSNCKYAIVLDFIVPRVEMVLNGTGLKKVIVLSQINHELEKVACEKVANDRYIAYWDLRNIETNYEVPIAKFNPNKPSLMVQSSGTTGKPKTIVHSDLSLSAYTYKLAHSDLPFGRNKRMLVVMPPCIAYCLGDAIGMSLALGSTVIFTPNFESDILLKYAGQFSLSFAAPFHYRYLKDNFNTFSEDIKEKIYSTECFISGGDKISVEENREFETLFKTSLVNGYGNNECFGGLTVNPTKHNKYGTVGIPIYKSTVIAYDEDEGKELQYGEVGEICALTETAFLCYENNKDETDKIKIKHNDGQIWLHTGDLGFIDEEGFITLVGRKRRVIIRKAFKIAAYTIEDNICEHESVKECVAVSVEDPEEEHAPMAFIVLKDGYKDNVALARESIIEKCKSELKEYEIPKHFRFVDSLPYTANGKYDFKLLEKMGNEEIIKEN